MGLLCHFSRVKGVSGGEDAGRIRQVVTTRYCGATQARRSAGGNPDKVILDSPPRSHPSLTVAASSQPMIQEETFFQSPVLFSSSFFSESCKE